MSGIRYKVPQNCGQKFFQAFGSDVGFVFQFHECGEEEQGFCSSSNTLDGSLCVAVDN